MPAAQERDRNHLADRATRRTTTPDRPPGLHECSLNAGPRRCRKTRDRRSPLLPARGQPEQPGGARPPRARRHEHSGRSLRQRPRALGRAEGVLVPGDSRLSVGNEQHHRNRRRLLPERIRVEREDWRLANAERAEQDEGDAAVRRLGDVVRVDDTVRRERSFDCPEVAEPADRAQIAMGRRVLVPRVRSRARAR
jgi:hypothetical protein